MREKILTSYSIAEGKRQRRRSVCLFASALDGAFRLSRVSRLKEPFEHRSTCYFALSATDATLPQDGVPVELQEAPLSFGKAADVHHGPRRDAHALQRRLVRDQDSTFAPPLKQRPTFPIQT
jgi:hypothetical protein